VDNATAIGPVLAAPGRPRKQCKAKPSAKQNNGQDGERHPQCISQHLNLHQNFFELGNSEARHPGQLRESEVGIEVEHLANLSMRHIKLQLVNRHPHAPLAMHEAGRTQRSVKT
jgi:hypothetical protein